MIDLQPHKQGVVLRVRARAGAARDGLAGEHDGALKVTVTQAPERGKANQAIARLLSKTLGLRRSQVELIAGETSPQKQFLLHETTVDELSRRITQVLGDNP